MHGTYTDVSGPELALSDSLCMHLISMFIIVKTDYFNCGFPSKVTFTFLLQENIHELSEFKHL